MMFTDEPRFAFGGNALERLSENRADDALATVLARDGLRCIGLAKGRVLVDPAPGPGKSDALHPRATFDAFDPKPDRAVWLGDDACGPVVALPLGIDPDDTALPPPLKAIDVRSLAMQGLVAPDVLGIVAQAASLVAWNGTHRFCSRCGAASEPIAAGYKRRCSGCGAEHFPRTDPVVIMLTVRGDRCLLGRGKHFPEGMFSALAGFLEPGETIEAAVRRETLEESGVHVGRVRYHGSQPWPFPHTLMIGCYGEGLSDAIDYDAEELAECRWFDRAEVREAIEDASRHRGVGTQGEAGQFYVPPPMAIAHQLMRAWALGEV